MPSPLEEKYLELEKQARELRKSGHAVVLYSVWDSQTKMVSCDLTHYLTCIVCEKTKCNQTN